MPQVNEFSWFTNFLINLIFLVVFFFFLSYLLPSCFSLPKPMEQKINLFTFML